MRIWLAAAAALFVFQAIPAQADPDHDPWSGAPLPPDKKRPIPSPITDHFYVRGTFFNPAVTTTLRVDASPPGPNLPNPTGTVVNGEKDLGLDSRIPQGRIEIMFRLRERNKLRVDYFETNRRADHVLSRQILFGDQTFDVGDRTSTSVDWRTFGLTYTYSFIRTDRIELGGGIAAHFLEADCLHGARPVLSRLGQQLRRLARRLPFRSPVSLETEFLTRRRLFHHEVIPQRERCQLPRAVQAECPRTGSVLQGQLLAIRRFGPSDGSDQSAQHLGL
jgi:hypothetical protein